MRSGWLEPSKRKDNDKQYASGNHQNFGGVKLNGQHGHFLSKCPDPKADNLLTETRQNYGTRRGIEQDL